MTPRAVNELPTDTPGRARGGGRCLPRALSRFSASPGAGGSAAAGGDPQAYAQQLSRIVSARVHHTRLSTVRNSNSRRVGRSLASLHPSWVSGLIRYAKGQHPKHDEVRSWREITRIVRAANPQAEFDVTLNAKQYRDGGELMRMMQRVRADLDNDGWFFDFYSTAFRKRPRMIRAAIASAHAHGEWIGGNVFGLSHRRPMPLAVGLPLRPGLRSHAQPARGAPAVGPAAGRLPPPQRPREAARRWLPFHRALSRQRDAVL